jgi:uncharacterized protein (DUF305 family)
MKTLLVTLLAADALFGQNLSSESPSIVQPGAPGEESKRVSVSPANLSPRRPVDADIKFMQGMIHHHSQAVDMVELLKTHGRDKNLQELGKRISISQTDEIQYMRQWLEERGQAVPMPHEHMTHMAGASGMNHMDMGSMPPMPGMLSPAQMDALAKASGRAFDRLFLTGMIQHHTGALTMVQDLFDTAGAGQDYVLFDFATDIDNTQRAEIGIMQRMLREMK